MDAWMSAQFLFWSIVVLVMSMNLCKKGRLKLPPGPRGWPIIGNLHVMAQPLLHRYLAHLSATYGPLLYLQLGCRPALVISSTLWAKEILGTHDKVFGDRPDMEVGRRITYGSVTFARTGEYWKQMRKTAVLGLLSPKRVQGRQVWRMVEIKKALMEISPMVPINIHDLAGNIVGAIMGGLLFSCSSISMSLQLRQLALDITEEVGSSLILGDFFSYLGFLDVLPRARLDRLRARRHAVFKKQFKLRRAHRLKYSSSSLHHEHQEDLPQCYLDILLASQEQGDLINSRDDSLEGALMDQAIGGIDTTSSTVEWAMAELIRAPEKLHKLNEEMDREVSWDATFVEDKDVGKLKYLQAVVKETLRLHPPVPLLIPRQSTEWCRVGEYELPKGTLVYVNAWAIGRDAEVWEKAQEFMPERFCSSGTEGNQGKVKEEGFVVFGGGRRGCPGMMLGLTTVQLIVANLVRAFEWKLSVDGDGDGDDPLDMREKSSITVFKATPLTLRGTPRQFKPTNISVS